MAKRVELRSNLLSYNVTAGGYKQFDIVPSKVTEAEFKRLVKRANDRLYKLEKKGLTNKSREYRMVEHYAVSDPNGKGNIYNVKANKGTIRFTSSLKGLDSKQKAYLINTVRNFMLAETSTIGGTKKAFNRAFETFKKNRPDLKNMTQEQYENLWQTYRDMVEKDKLASAGYNAFMELVEKTNLYELSSDEMETALSYIENSDASSTTGVLSDVLDAVQMEEDFDLTLI